MESKEIREWDSDQDSADAINFESPNIKKVYVNVPNDESPPRDPDSSVNKTHLHEFTPVSPPPQERDADVNTKRVEPFVDDSRLDLNPAEGTMPFDESVGTVKFTRELPSPDKTFGDYADYPPSNLKELRRASQGEEKERYRLWKDMTLEEPTTKSDKVTLEKPADTDDIRGLCPACFDSVPLLNGLAKCDKCWGICLECFGEDLLNQNKCKACNKA